jgi:hypothetical protein
MEIPQTQMQSYLWLKEELGKAMPGILTLIYPVLLVEWEGLATGIQHLPTMHCLPRNDLNYLILNKRGYLLESRYVREPSDLYR